MHRRTLLRGLAVTGGAGLAGCSRQEVDVVSGTGTLTIENRSGGETRTAYGLLAADESIGPDTLTNKRLTMDGDSVEVVFTEVAGGTYRFVVTVLNTDWTPMAVEWNLNECIEREVTVQVLPAMLNTAESRCVRPGNSNSLNG